MNYRNLPVKTIPSKFTPAVSNNCIFTIDLGKRHLPSYTRCIPAVARGSERVWCLLRCAPCLWPPTSASRGSWQQELPPRSPSLLLPSDRVDPTLSDAAAALADVAGAAAAGAAAAGSNPRRRCAGEREMREGEADRARARRFEGAASAPHIWRPGVSPGNIRCVIQATAALRFFIFIPYCTGSGPYTGHRCKQPYLSISGLARECLFVCRYLWDGALGVLSVCFSSCGCFSESKNGYISVLLQVW